MMKRLASLNRLTKLRDLLRSKKLHAYIVPTEDEHFSEYVDPSDQRCAFISGFTGSLCTTIITLDKAALWTDGRYHLQASQQLDENWTLMKKGLEGVPTEAKWLAEVTPSGTMIGYDPKQIPFTTMQSYKTELSEAEAALEQATSESGNGMQKRQLVPVDGPNLIDLVWAEMRDSGEEGAMRPLRPANPVRIVPLSFAGQTWLEKVHRIIDQMRQNGASLLAVTALDEIAWLLNLRGSDIQCSPVFFAYALLSFVELQLFLDPRTVASSSELKQHLLDPGFKVTIYPYHEFFDHLHQSVSELAASSARVWLDYRVSEAVVMRVPENKRLFRNSPISDMKAVKLPTELDGIRDAHVEDSLVLCDFLAWLDQLSEANRCVKPECDNPRAPLDGRLCEPAGTPVLDPPEKVTESSAADYLDRLRSQAPGFVSLSFSTISGADANGAVIHYRAEPGQDAPITSSTLYLVDSGGQYLTGTTDVTRTVHLGQPTPRQKACYTLVLKSHIALSDQIFPPNTPGSRLDIIARHIAWRYRCDYAHGTGHGVGAFLGVHEGPIGMSGSRLAALARMGMVEPGVQKDMVLTIEPGYYLGNEFGIRLENVVFVVSATGSKHADLPPCSSTGDDSWLGFDPVTLVPFQRRLIEQTMLEPCEVQWLNRYHANVRRILIDRLNATSAGLLSGSQKRCMAWILRETEPIV